MIFIIGQKLGVNSASVMGLLLSLGTSIAMIPLFSQMDRKGKMMNAAFSVSGAYVLGGQLGFISSVVDGNGVIIYMISKIIAGLLAIVFVLIFYREEKCQWMRWKNKLNNIAGVNNEGFIEIISNCLNYVDSRLIDHGLRVANMTYRMLEAQNSHEQKYLQDVFMLAMLHDIGAYKTEKIDQMFIFETKNIWQHAIYGYLFIKNFSPLDKLAPAILYHHLDYQKMIYIDDEIKNISQIINLCDRIDVFLQTSNDYSMLKDYLDKESGTRFVENLVTTLYWQVDQVYQFTTNPFSNGKK